MLREMMQSDVEHLVHLLQSGEGWPGVDPDFALIPFATQMYELLLRLSPDHPELLSRLALTYHLSGQLRTAGEYYQKVLTLCPVEPMTESIEAKILQHAPILKVNRQECFDLLDVVAIHHPSKPIIAYHLFWEDDYDFPDDYEPCDHEVVWVRYTPQEGAVTEVSSFFHSDVMTTPEATTAANLHDGRATVYIEWGKHGSLLEGWENATAPSGRRFVREVLQRAFENVSQGGRLPHHPLKRDWPKRFEGTFEDYLDFSNSIDVREFLTNKPQMSRTEYGNAVLQQHFLRYNFHPKYDWPWQVLTYSDSALR